MSEIGKGEVRSKMDDLLKTLVDLRNVVQRARIAYGNRVDAILSGRDSADTHTLAVLAGWRDRFADMEEQASEQVAEQVGDNDIVAMMSQIKGIDKILAAQVVALVDIARCNTVSALWRYAGYGVIDGVRERPTKGERLHYNKTLKTVCFKIAGSFLRSNSPYRQIYDEAKAYYETERPTWTKGHRHYAAMRKMIKIWLQHLWVMWRKWAELPTDDPYVITHLGHEHYLPPSDFGWPDIDVPEGW